MLTRSLLIPPTQRRGQTNLEHRFRCRLAEVVVPLIRHADVTLGCLGAGRPIWLAQASGCHCSETHRPSDCGLARHGEIIDIAYNGRPLDRVLLCCSTRAGELRLAVGEVVRSLARTMELEESESSLLQELSGCWEHLEALREINAGMHSLEEATHLLDRIMTRAIALEEGLQAILWIERDGKLEPQTVKAELPCGARPCGCGLVGQSIAAGHGVIINGRHRILVACTNEPELVNAQCVLVAPVRTRQGFCGALEIWNDEPCTLLDSRSMHLAEVLALQAILVAENDRLHQAELESQRLRQELEIGSTIERVLLTSQLPPALPPFDVAASSLPSRYVDGDFLDFYRHGAGTLDLVIADVMGKGIPAALVGAAAKHQLTRAFNRALVNGSAPLPAVREILHLANAELAPRLIAIERFITLCYARLQADQRTLSLVDCGHTRHHPLPAAHRRRGHARRLQLSARL